VPSSDELRILPSRHGWWALGPHGVARLPAGAASGGALTPRARAQLAARGFFERPQEDTYYLTVLTTTRCNLGCSYCFQNTGPAAEGSHRPPRIRGAALSEAVTEDIIRFASERMAEADVAALHILLFGGEPLINPKGAIRLLRRARMIGLRTAEMVTNATLLRPELAIELQEAGLTQLQVTFDGDLASHDRLRVTRSGRGTFERILANIAAADAVTTLQWVLRVNISDPEDFDADELLTMLAAHVAPTGATISLHLIDDVGVGYECTPLDAHLTATRFADWYAAAQRLGFGVPVAAGARRCVYCTERNGRTGAVVNADGVLYSCWETVGKEGMEVGALTEGYLDETSTAGRWVSCGYQAKPHWSATDKRAFADHVDATNLDWMLEHGVLPARPRG
jgi:uncharacterized protein